MKLPWVSRARFEDLQARYEELWAAKEALTLVLAEGSNREITQQQEHKSTWSRPTINDIRSRATAAARGRLTGS